MAETLIDLRGKGGQWGGIVDTTELVPASGPVSAMTNLVVSRDGSELKPAPGTRIAGKPFYGQSFVVTAVVAETAQTVITVNALADADGNAFLPGVFYVYIPVDSEFYVATRTDIAEFTIPSILTAVDVGDYVLVSRYVQTHDMATVDGRAAIVFETATYHDVLNELNNLGTMVCSGPLSIDSPPGPGVPDETDEGFVLWPSPTAFPINTAEYGHDITDGTGGESLISYLRHYDILRRMQCEGINGRLLIAVPGVGIMFEANLRRASDWFPRDQNGIDYQPNPRFTKMLGIPRGHMPHAAVVDSGVGSLANGWYAFAVAYYDPYQDTVGLLSPLQMVEATGGNSKILAYATMPRGVAFETVGLQIILYAAGPFSTGATGELEAIAATVQPIAVSGPFRGSLDYPAQNTSGASYCVRFDVSSDFNLSADLRPRRIGELEVPPAGASWLRVARARVFHGGELPAYWDFEAWPRRLAPLSTGASADFPTEYYLVLPLDWNVNAPSRAPMAWGRFPPSIEGRIISRINTSQVADIGIVTDLSNAVEGSIAADLPSGASGPPTLKVDYDFGNVTTTAGNLESFRIFSRRQGARFTEEDKYGVEPAINELPIDALADVTTTGGARINDQVILFTLNQTHLFSWAAMPRGSGAIVLSNRYGCASPHSIVEYSGGAAWLSAKGPCVTSGQLVIWVGEKLEATWESFLKDSEGMLVCGGAAADESTKTIYWALRRATDSLWLLATTDELKAKVPCDTLLCWNWATNAFSLIEMNETVASFKAMLYDDGSWRPTVATSTLGVQVTDDAYRPLLALTGSTQRLSTTQEFTAGDVRDPANEVFFCSGSVGVVADGDPAFIRTPDGDTLRWFGTVASATVGGVTLDDADGIGWLVGDVLVTGGPRHGTLTTHRMRMSPDGSPGTVRRVLMEIDSDCDYLYASVSSEADEDGNSVTWPAMRLSSGTNELMGHSFGDHLAMTVTIIADGAYSVKSIQIGGEESHA